MTRLMTQSGTCGSQGPFEHSSRHTNDEQTLCKTYLYDFGTQY